MQLYHGYILSFASISFAFQLSLHDHPTENGLFSRISSINLSQCHSQVLHRRGNEIVFPIHACLCRLVGLHVKLPKDIREVKVKFLIGEIHANAGAWPMRKCNESFFELGSVGTEPALGLEALRFGEVGWVHVVAVGDAGDGSLRIVRRENGQSSVIYTPAGTFCPHRTAPPSGTTLGILCACEHLVVYGRDSLIYLPSRNTHTQPEAFLYHSTL